MLRTITALLAQKRNPQRINVYLDGEFAFGLARIVAAWLYVGQQLSDEKIADLQTDDNLEAAYQKALRLLSHRERSRAEITQKLQQQDMGEEVIQAVLERLERSGLVDDQRFARTWVANRAEFRPRGRRALAYELSRRGIDRQAVQTALNDLDEDSLAYEAAQKQARRWRDLGWNEFRNRLYGFLARRGFNHETCAPVARRVWAELHPDGVPEHTDDEKVD